MKRLRPETAYWVLSGARAMLLSMIFTASTVYYVNRVGLNPLQLVLVGTTLEVSVLLFEVPTGVVADVYSRRLSILIGIALMGAGFLVEGSWPTFAAVLTAQVMWGIGYTFTSGATQAWIVDEVGEANAGRVFLRRSQAQQLCDLIGIGIGVGLGSLLINLPILAGGVGLILLAGLLAATMPEQNFTPKVDTAKHDLIAGFNASRKTLRDALRIVRAHPALLTIFGIGLFYGLYSEGYDRLSVAHLLKDVSLPTVGGLAPVIWVGSIRAAESLLSLAATEVVRRRLDVTQAKALTQTLFAFSTALAGALAAFALAGNFWVAAALMIGIGMLRELIGPLYDTWMNQRLDSNVRATVISISGQVDAVGQIAGGPGVGWIGNTISIRVALLTSAAILSPVLGLYGYAFRRNGVPAGEETQGELAI